MSIHNRGTAPKLEPIGMNLKVLQAELRQMVMQLQEDYGLLGPQARDVAKQVLARMLDELKMPKYLGDD